MDYMKTAIIQLSQKYPSAKFLIADDFNLFQTINVCAQVELQDKADFNKRADTKLDLILTDLSECNMAEELSPIINNDHRSILMKGTSDGSFKYISTKRRITTLNMMFCQI